MKYALFPLWLLQLLTQAKSFKSNRIIGNLWLNKLGLHVVRIILSHSIMHLRMRMLSRGVTPEQRQHFFKHGYLVLDNVLPAIEFEAIKREVAEVNAEVRECIQGDTLTHRIVLDEGTSESLSQCHSMLRDKTILNIHKFGSGKNNVPVSYIQTIKNHFVDGPSDPQKNLHSDTFHPTMKSWYFLDNVDDDNGPFNYVPGSHRLSLSRLKWEYKKSIAICNDGDRYSSNGSFRITPEDLVEMGFDGPIALKVPGNTLVMANTHGFHRRGDARLRSMRTELWSISRSNPFNPFPGIDLPIMTKLQNKALSLHRQHCDRKAAKTGGHSSWHIVESRNTLEDSEYSGSKSSTSSEAA